jgi:uncharacterized protein YuzE
MYLERDLENNQLYVGFGIAPEEGSVADAVEAFPGVFLDVTDDGKLVGIDIVNTEEVIGAAVVDLTFSGELVGVKEAAELVGKDRANFLRDVTRRSDFPRPVARVASSQLWLAKDIARYLEKQRSAEKEEPNIPMARNAESQDNSGADSESATSVSLKDGLRTLGSEDFRLIAVGSRDNWLRLSDYPESTTRAISAAKNFLADSGVPVYTMPQETAERAWAALRDAVDEHLAEVDPLEARRMLRSEQAHAQEAKDFYRRSLENRVSSGHMNKEEASDRLRRFSESA